MKRGIFGFVFFGLICSQVFLSRCQEVQEPKRLSRFQRRAMLQDSLARFSALPQHVKSPLNNPTSPEKVALGRFLFFDPIISGNKDVACATCHHPSSGFAESLEISIGVNGRGFGSKRHFLQPNKIPFTKRNSQTVLNTAFNGINIYNKYAPADAPMFWDLRANSLEKQALEPLKALEEMRGTQFQEDEILKVVVTRLKNIPEYTKLFAEAFPQDTEISQENIGKAIAAYERTLLTNNSRFDQYMRGDKTAISISEREGFEEFKRAGCGNCHNGPMFSDFQKHVLGVPDNPKLPTPDLGTDNTNAFRTPSLRNLRFTFPYMHNGSLSSLKRVLEFYEDISFGKMKNPRLNKEDLDPLVKEIRLQVKDMGAIISFLNTLNDDSFDKTIPASVPSGLHVGGEIQ